MNGRVCVVTGAGRGIGRAVATGLAQTGATVVIVVRDDARGRATADEIRRDTPGDVALVVADVSSLRAVRAAALEITTRWPAVHVLVNNAGVSLARRQESVDRIEMTFAVNHLAPFLLTRLLMPALARGAQARVINVSSQFAPWGRLDLGDLQATRSYNGTRAYLQSKLATLAFTLELAERARSSGVVVNAVYPALAVTALLRDRWWWRARALRPLWRALFATPAESAASIVRLATEPALASTSGVVFDARLRETRVPRQVRDRDVRAALWRASEVLVAAGGGQALETR